MNFKSFTWGLLAGLALLPSTASAQWCFSTLPCGHLPIPAAPDTCGPGFYVVNCAGLVYGPSYYLHAPFPPFQGKIFCKPIPPICPEQKDGPDPRKTMAWPVGPSMMLVPGYAAVPGKWSYGVATGNPDASAAPGAAPGLAPPPQKPAPGQVSPVSAVAGPEGLQAVQGYGPGCPPGPAGQVPPGVPPQGSFQVGPNGIVYGPGGLYYGPGGWVRYGPPWLGYGLPYGPAISQPSLPSPPSGMSAGAPPWSTLWSNPQGLGSIQQGPNGHVYGPGGVYYGPGPGIRWWPGPAAAGSAPPAYASNGAPQQNLGNPYRGPYGPGPQDKSGIPTFPIHPCVRSPRDYFMVGEER